MRPLEAQTHYDVLEVSRSAELREIERAYKVLQSTYAPDSMAVAIVGPVNSGKSSLFNALLGRERSIVTAEPGTTRGVSRSSIRTSQRPPLALACRNEPMAATRLPKWSGPVGDGAKRPTDLPVLTRPPGSFDRVLAVAPREL